MQSDKRKVVQTTLTRDEYELLADTLSKRGMTIQEGLRKAALELVESSSKVDPNDPFFRIKPSRSGGPSDLSTKHDIYLYGEEEKASQRGKGKQKSK